MQLARRLAIVAVLSTLVSVVATASPAAATVERSSTAASAVGVASRFSKATARLKVPEFTCPETGESGLFESANWRTTDDSSNASIVVLLHCLDGTESVIAYVFHDGVSQHFTNVAMDDFIVASFSYKPLTGELIIKATDTTTDESVTTGGTTAGLTFTTAEYFVSRFTSDGSIPLFILIPFSQLTINGAPAVTKLSITRTDLFHGNTRLLHTRNFESSGTRFNFQLLATS